MMQTNEGKNYIVYHFAPNQNTPIYIYSLEVTEKPTYVKNVYLATSSSYNEANFDTNLHFLPNTSSLRLPFAAFASVQPEGRKNGPPRPR